MLHTFNGPCYTKYDKYIKKNVIAIMFFMYFSFFVQQGPSKVCNMKHSYQLNENYYLETINLAQKFQKHMKKQPKNEKYVFQNNVFFLQGKFSIFFKKLLFFCKKGLKNTLKTKIVDVGITKKKWITILTLSRNGIKDKILGC